MLRPYHFYTLALILIVSLFVALWPTAQNGGLTTVRAATEYYAAPNGQSTGDGSKDKPWDLKTALTSHIKVKPGDTINLRGGDYKIPSAIFVTLKGTSAAPILVRSAPGEWARFEITSTEQALMITEGRGTEWVTWRDFEVYNPNVNRQPIRDGSTRAAAIEAQAPNHKFINLIIHDAGQGFGFRGPAVNNEIYGSLIYNVGNTAEAHGIYAANNDGTKPKRIIDNIIFSTAGFAIHGYGKTNSKLLGFHIEGNTAFNNGAIVHPDGNNSVTIQAGGQDTPTDEVVVQENYVYNNLPYSNISRGIRLGYTYSPDGDGKILNNYVAALRPIEVATRWTTLERTGNTEVDLDNPRPSGVKTFVRPNQYESGRANITVFNWDKKSSVPVNLSSVLAVGAQYEIRDAQNYFAAPVVSGTYDGKDVSVPMNLTQIATPLGAVQRMPKHTAPEFGVFIVRTTNGQGGTIPTPTPAPEGEPKLSVTKVVDKSTAQPGDTLTYTITVKNTGNAEAVNVVVTDQLVQRLTFVSASSGGTNANGVTTWQIPTLAAGGQTQLTLQAQVN